ncbi:MAG: hypothetical protein H0X66_14910 [Verrucomicrobia bacterium]|nr:hypothetical protein [Verrucomicrobiota bacterium]
MNKRFTIAVIILLAAGMIAPLWIVMKQRRLIAELQQVQSSPEESSAGIEEVDAVPLLPEPLFAEVIEPEPPVSVAPQLTPTNVEFEKLKVENERSKAITRRMSNQPSTAQQARMVEDIDAAYVGPGTWVEDHSNAQGPSAGPTGRAGAISKIVISGKFPAENHIGLNRLKVQAWENCPPEECAWGEVAFFLADAPLVELSYRHGLAAWTIDGITRYVLITFYKDGLYIERIDSKDGRHVLRAFYRMSRVN